MKGGYILVLLVTAMLVGCGGDSTTNEREPDAWYSITVPLGDAYHVICVTNDLEDAISCNWDDVLRKP